MSRPDRFHIIFGLVASSDIYYVNLQRQEMRNIFLEQCQNVQNFVFDFNLENAP